MPFPIRPMHELERNDGLFEGPEMSSDDLAAGLSDLQSFFLGTTKEAAKKKWSEDTIRLLEAITKSEDEVVTAASKLSCKEANQVYYRVPSNISDGELLGLKAQGLITGSGRAVTLTEQGKVALRDKWLVSENHLKRTRAKAQFDYKNAAEEIKPLNKRASQDSKFTRLAEKKFKRETD